MVIRSPICTVVGHVDHGKSSILDKIRGSAIVKGESGGITQAIGASIIPLDTIKKICGNLLQSLKQDFTIPGLLFIDTPGHAAFTNLRKRGGNLADIAILVIDIKEGIKPQTIESIEILKAYKTPFLIAANKVDLISGWESKDGSVLKSINELSANANQEIETKVYEIVGKLAELGLEADRFDRIEDYSKRIAIIPCSAQTGDGIPELLMLLTGLAQKYLENCLSCNVKNQAKGIILEVKEDKGIGKSLDVIIYDGTLKVNDTVVIGGIKEPIVTKIRALFEPAPLSEMRDKKSKFRSVKMVAAATGVKIAAPDIQDVVAGMPLLSILPSDLEKAKTEVQKDVDQVIISTDQTGLIIKADSLGSLEALIRLLQEANIPIKKATIGNISKKDISDACSNYEESPFYSVILGFNVKDMSGVCDERVKIICSPIIYSILDTYKQWVEEQKKCEESKKLENLTQPAKIHTLKGFIFRQSNPAVIGVEVMYGTLKANTSLMDTNGKNVAFIKTIQANNKTAEKAEKKEQVAISLPHVTVGRQIMEDIDLYSDITEEEFKTFKSIKSCLSQDQKMLLKEIGEIKRRENPVWGV